MEICDFCDEEITWNGKTNLGMNFCNHLCMDGYYLSRGEVKPENEDFISNNAGGSPLIAVIMIAVICQIVFAVISYNTRHTLKLAQEQMDR
jgi:hypothetical protein